MTKKISIIWPFVLIGLPLIAVIFMVTGSIYERDSYGYWLTVYSRILLFTVLLLMVFNFIFSLYSSTMVLRSRSIAQGVLAFFFSVISLGLASYFLVRFWRSQGIEVFSAKDKTYSDIFSLIFFVLIGVVFSMSFFIAGVEYDL